MKLPEKIIMGSLTFGFLMMTANYFVLGIYYDKAMALAMAEQELYSIKDTCFDRSQTTNDVYSIYVTNEADKRTVLVKWKTFFMKQSFSIVDVNPKECQE